jgi:CheY-like chemotaxis protein
MIDYNAAASADGQSGKIHILVVDDDAIIAMNSAALLEELGYAAIEAGSGAEALDILHRRQEIALLITDQVMPGMRGNELITQARRIRPELPAILATGYDDLLRECPPRVSRLAKPFGLAELAVTVGAALGLPDVAETEWRDRR